MTTEIVFTVEQMRALIAKADTDSQQYLFRFVEQAVLQSPEIQRLRDDAARYRWWREYYFNDEFSPAFIPGQAATPEALDAMLSLAMKAQP